MFNFVIGANLSWQSKNHGQMFQRFTAHFPSFLRSVFCKHLQVACLHFCFDQSRHALTQSIYKTNPKTAWHKQFRRFPIAKRHLGHLRNQNHLVGIPIWPGRKFISKIQLMSWWQDLYSAFYAEVVAKWRLCHYVHSQPVCVCNFSSFAHSVTGHQANDPKHMNPWDTCETDPNPSAQATAKTNCPDYIFWSFVLIQVLWVI